MKPYLHGKISVKKWGGKPADYQKIHDFIDSSKAHFPDMRHRAILHSSFGIYIAEQVFGTNITNSDNRLVSVRDIAEQHVIDDLGRIPTVQDYLVGMPLYPWLGGPKRKPKKSIDMTVSVEEMDQIVKETNEIPGKLSKLRPQTEKEKREMEKTFEQYRIPRNPLIID
jgi:hypothetical protein